MLDLCMYAGNPADNEHITVFGDEGKLESLPPAPMLRHGRCEDRGTRKVWGGTSGSGKGVSMRRVWNMNIKYAGRAPQRRHRPSRGDARRAPGGLVAAVCRDGLRMAHLPASQRARRP